MIDELNLARFVDLGVERELRIGRAAMNESAAGVVADPSHHRSADAGGADHRMRLATQRLQRPLQFKQRRARQTDDLPACVDQADCRHAQRG